MNRVFAATAIHDGKIFLPQSSVLVLNKDQKIVCIRPRTAEDSVEYYEGILCPGWVNSHCHVELSHLKGRIDKGQGLLHFLQQVIQLRNQFTSAEIKHAINNALAYMQQTGVVALGDIANTTDAASALACYNIHTHTFIEAIGFDDLLAQKSWDRAKELQQQWKNQSKNNRLSISAHAPYSISSTLFSLIAENADSHLPQTIHNQEWSAENELYQSKTGEAITLLQQLNINTASFTPTGKNSLPSYLHHYSPHQILLLVHNIQTQPEDIQHALQHSKNLWWCLCPNANLYIEGRLPNLALLQQHTDQICIGTDSLASNDRLDMVSEINILKKHFPFLSWETLIKWATHNGACALQMDHRLGSLSPEKDCGILHVQIKNDTLHFLQRIA